MKPRIDQDSLGLAARQALQKHLERLEIAIATRELQRLDTRPVSTLAKPGREPPAKRSVSSGA